MKHNRLQLLNAGTRVLCFEHGTVETVTDAFSLPDGLLLELACGCRRDEDCAMEGR